MHQAECHREILLSVFASLGIPIEPSKLEGPSTCLSFLGIEADTATCQLRLPADKLSRLQAALKEALGRKALTKHNFQSLVGLLQHAAKVVKPGRAFMRRLHSLLSYSGGMNHTSNQFIRLNMHARADILWWHVFASQWNGVSMLWGRVSRAPDTLVTSDASGSWGCGALWGPHWFMLQWPPSLQGASIQVKELVPVVLAAALYGKQWAGKVVEFKSDNMPVVDVLEDTYSRNGHLMHLTRLLIFWASYHQFWFTASHIPGASNILADAISRNNLALSFSQVPQAAQQPTQIPSSLVDLLALEASWTSTDWMELFVSTLRQL